MSVARRDGFIPADMRVVITPTGERITIHQQPLDKNTIGFT
ncbi:hypothetical protein LCGC14_1395220 [marine sediment metagenome]|uniref:Uncharacterized protein n=1 Tax=marine sediment metagenome TaxID=412755 RepID=A0A0F9MED0_9ZZZZ